MAWCPVCPKVSVAIKRLLLGQPFRSDKLNPRCCPNASRCRCSPRTRCPLSPTRLRRSSWSSVAGVSALTFTPWVAVAVAVVMVVVVASYRQNVHAYPSGGGDYEIANVNLGANAGLTVGSALLVDYVLTVAVSIASAAENIGSAFPFVHEHKVWFSVAAIAVLTAVNLRGIRESGAVLAIPTYAFIVGVGAMLIWGFVEIFVLDRDVTAETSEFGLKAEDSHLAGIAFVFLIARAFSSGCAALTGVEAISNRVPAFRKPKSRNAAATLMMLGAFSITLLLGIVVLAQEIGAKYVMDPANDLVGAPENYHQKSMIAQLSLAVFGEGSPAFYFVAAATALILILAANTAFNGFPLLASVLAQDRYLPRQMHTRGDRLAFSNGILFLAIAAMIFVISFGAEVTVLDPALHRGRVRFVHPESDGDGPALDRLLRTETDPQSRKRMFQSRIVNSVGLVMTAIVLVVVLITKFTAGAWIAIVLMVAVFVLMKLIHSHYASVQEELDRDDESAVLPSRTHSIVLVSGLNLATRRAVRYARATRPDMLEAITVNVDDRSTRTLVSLWEASEIEIPLKVIASPYREITGRCSTMCAGSGASRPGCGHRVHPRIRGRALVGADAAQPVRVAPQDPAALRAGSDGHVGAVAARFVGPPQES